MALTIGVDIGGTKVAAGVVDESGRILVSDKRETPAQDPKATEDTIADAINDLAGSRPGIAAAGIGAAGFIDQERATVLFAPNLAWREEPIKAELEKRVGLPIVIENDANAAAWGETKFGAGRWLGVGLASLAAAFDPGCFIIGGGVSDAEDLLLGPARESFHRSLVGRGYRPEAKIKIAALGPEAGVVGAADLARQWRASGDGSGEPHARPSAQEGQPHRRIR
jgi:predicted NBD/HSP70 family sugar kinase